jgi:hypothetical protein
MSKWKVLTDAIGIALLDSQDMDYSVKLQKNQTVIAKRQLHQHDLLALKHNRVLVGRTWKKIVKVLKFFSFLNKSVSGLLCIKELFIEMKVSNYHLDNNPHMHDQFEMIPEETKKILLDFMATSINNCTWTKERKSLLTSRTHTSWWHKDGSHKFPTLMPNVQYEGLQIWRK